MHTSPNPTGGPQEGTCRVIEVSWATLTKGMDAEKRADVLDVAEKLGTVVSAWRRRYHTFARLVFLRLCQREELDMEEFLTEKFFCNIFMVLVGGKDQRNLQEESRQQRELIREFLPAFQEAAGSRTPPALPAGAALIGNYEARYETEWGGVEGDWVGE